MSASIAARTWRCPAVRRKGRAPSTAAPQPAVAREDPARPAPSSSAAPARAPAGWRAARRRRGAGAPAKSGATVGRVVRPMQAPERGREARPAAPREPGRILPFGQLRQVLERLPREPAEDARAQALGQRVDRLHGAARRELGGRQDQLGMDDLPVAPVAREDAADHPLAAFGQGVAQIGLAGAEEDQMRARPPRSRSARDRAGASAARRVASAPAAGAAGRSRPRASGARLRPRRAWLAIRLRSTTACGRCQSRSRRRAATPSGRPNRRASARSRRGPDALQPARRREQGGERPSPGAAPGAAADAGGGARRDRSPPGFAIRCRAATCLAIDRSTTPRDARSANMSEPIAIRRKRLIHQSRYRGRLEGDLLLGRFADRHLAGSRRRPARSLRGAARRERSGPARLGLRPGAGAGAPRPRRVPPAAELPLRRPRGLIPPARHAL